MLNEIISKLIQEYLSYFKLKNITFRYRKISEIPMQKVNPVFLHSNQIFHMIYEYGKSFIRTYHRI